MAEDAVTVGVVAAALFDLVNCCTAQSSCHRCHRRRGGSPGVRQEAVVSGRIRVAMEMQEEEEEKDEYENVQPASAFRANLHSLAPCLLHSLYLFWSVARRRGAAVATVVVESGIHEQIGRISRERKTMCESKTTDDQ